MSELLGQSSNPNKPTKRGLSPAAFSVGMLLGLLVAGLFVLIQNRSQPVEQHVLQTELNETTQLIDQALRQVSSDYIDEIPPEELAQAAIAGMFTKLDNYSKYLDEDTYQGLVQQTDGEYLGIGIQAETIDGYITIMDVNSESPAARIGLQIDDKILAVNGKNIANKPAETLLNELRFAVDTVLSLNVQRDTENFDVQLSRDLIPVESIESHLISQDGKNVERESVVYVRISQFNENTASDLNERLEKLRRNESALYGLILDLRNNPGGLVTAAVEVADLFLQSGTIVSANGRAADADFVYQAEAGETFAEIPMVVLINQSTASAAEIVAAALKEQNRATLVGEKSFGKGLVQTIIPIDTGALKLTTSRYYTPSGISINERGIRPNISVEDSTMLLSVDELNKIHQQVLPHHMAIKDPAMLRAWQHLNRLTARDQLAMDTEQLESIDIE